LDVLKEYPHLLWTSEPDDGQSDAINKGFARATGDWLMWLNADDYLLPGSLREVRDFAAAHPDADVIYGDCGFVEESGKLLRVKREFDFDFYMLLFWGCYIPSTAAFYRRAIVDRGFLLDVSYKVGMDLEYYLRLADAGFQFRHLSKTLACFRWHASNVSSIHAERRYAERLQTQRRHLRKRGLSWLGNEYMLAALFRAYQAKRLMRRCMSRIRGT
jgi:glycosyltransferase involved in cell wall biosynthesis